MTFPNNAGAALALLLSLVSCSNADNGNSSEVNLGGTSSTGGTVGTVTTTLPRGGGTTQSSSSGTSVTGGVSSVGTTTAAGGSNASGGVSASTNGNSGIGGSVTSSTSTAFGTAGAAGTKVLTTGTTTGGSKAVGGSSATFGGTKAADGGTSAGGGTTTVAGTSGSGGTKAVGGNTSASGGAAGQPATTVDCGTESAVITYPTLPGATQSPLYTVTATGVTQYVEKLAKFSPEMPVHHAYFSIAKGCVASIAVTVKESFSAYTLSPKSKKISATKSGNTVTFNSGPNYLILKVDSKELLFILIDEQEAEPPKVGDSNVKSIADYNVDNTGATLETSKIQSAINAASGATQNVLYFPPGRYKVGEISMKSNMTLYLAGGSILDGSTKTGDYAAAGPAVEDTTHSVLHMNNITNAKVLGRGVIDGNGSVIRGSSNDTPAFKIDVMRIDDSSKIVVDGILVRDSVFWNTLIYNSDQVTIRNYKVINRRPTTTTYNQTDGIDFDCSTNGNVYNAFVYSGDDSLSPKREQEGKLDTNNITYEKVVAYTNSAATKVGTKTFGNTIDAVTFKDIDVVKAGRAMVIDANDTAVIKNTKWVDIRVEAADSNLIDIETDRAPDWRTAPNTSTVRDAYFTNVASEVKQLMNIHGKSSTVNVNGVHFSNFTVQGKKLTSQTDSAGSWNINQFVSNITFE